MQQRVQIMLDVYPLLTTERYLNIGVLTDVNVCCIPFWDKCPLSTSIWSPPLPKWKLSMSLVSRFGNFKTSNSIAQAYLPGTGCTTITKVVGPEWGLSIALRLGWPLRSPQMLVTRVRNFYVGGTAFALSPEQNQKKIKIHITKCLSYDLM